jgi:hypothetical protein
MNKEVIVRALNGAKYKIKDASPEILVVAGVVGGVTSAIMACKATRKIDTILEESKTVVEKIKEVEADPSISEIEYTPEDAKKDLAITYVRTAGKLLKLYAPSLIIGGLSITAIFASNNIMRKRNVALAAAYATVDKGFKEYKDRVVERFGEEVEREIACDTKAMTFTEEETDENGKAKKVKNKIPVSSTCSPYSVFFDSGCREWTKDSAHNKNQVLLYQNEFNEKLKRCGRLTLNEVYRTLGIPEIADGMVLGWMYNDKVDSFGDVCVDFGVFDMYKETNRDFVNGYENVILLDMRHLVNVYNTFKRQEAKISA